MEVRKFEAKSMQEALKMVKEELGPDAIILSARDRNKSFGIGGEKSIEVTAAISEQKLNERKFALSRITEENRRKITGLPSNYEKKFISKSVERYKKENAPKKTITTRQYIDIADEEAANKRANKKEMSKNENSYVAQGRSKQLQGLINEKNKKTDTKRTNAKGIIGHSIEDLIDEDVGQRRVKQAARAALHTAAKEWLEDEPNIKRKTKEEVVVSKGSKEITELKREIEKLQEVIHSFQKIPQKFVGSHPGADYGIPYDLSFMYEKLTQAGLEEELSSDILQIGLKDLGPKQCKKKTLVEAWTAKHILETVPICEENINSAIEVFVGSNSSGKTSTLIKYASNLVVMKRKKVAIVSTDVVKVGALEQMKIFSQILNVPFAAVQPGQSWKNILSAFKHMDCILVDTPGVTLKDLNEIDLLRVHMPPADMKAKVHYVQSVSVNESSAMELTRRFKMFDIDDIVFTHLDESPLYGLIYNLSIKHNLPIHSFGIGKNIPEDFEVATRERVLDLLFQITKLKGVS